MAPQINDCSFELIIDEESIVIEAGPIDVSIAYFSDFCDSSLSTADYLLDIEENIKTQIVEQMPDILTNELQSGIDEGLQQTQYIDEADLEICYKSLNVSEVRFSITGDFVTEEDEGHQETDNETETTKDDDDDIEQFSDAETVSATNSRGAIIPILFVVFVFMSFGIGICIAACIGSCYFKPKFREMHEKNSDGGDCEVSETTNTE